ncbi:DNA transposase THAP9 [Eumeta japonica]|uniref:DNA transposase THAP9 n=1 Tax=Eumeta variegata TaxID=151549 RepID=A0A4C1XXL4_EUMVA|nr:DNA transposase THAP9 [Eumeta japonica]
MKEWQHRITTGGGPSTSDASIDPDVAQVTPALAVGVDKAVDSDMVSEHPIYAGLIIDEMAIRRRIEWDGQRLHGHVDIGNGLNTDSLAEAKEALVFLVTAINGNWKIPVGYFLVDGITGIQRAERVKQCLKLIHETVRTIANFFSAILELMENITALSNLMSIRNSSQSIHITGISYSVHIIGKSYSVQADPIFSAERELQFSVRRRQSARKKLLHAKIREIEAKGITTSRSKSFSTMSGILNDAAIAEMLGGSEEEGDDSDEIDLDNFTEEYPEYLSSSSSDEGEDSDEDNVPLSMLAGWQKKPFNGKPLPEEALHDPGDIKLHTNISSAILLSSSWNRWL